MKVKILDIGAFVAVSTITALITLTVYVNRGQSLTVSVTAPIGEWFFPISTDMIFSEAGSGGTCIIEIQSGSVRVIESDCPIKICIKTGTISVSGQWIACLPHRIFIRIIGEHGKNIDTISY